jgi:CheY-like chemotaxis protein
MHTVRDGEEALMYLRREGPYKDVPQPGLLLLDINMPKKNGFEVMQELKGDPQLRSLPVIMLTTNDRTACSSQRLSPHRPAEVEFLVHVAR